MDIISDLLKNPMFYTALLALLNALRVWLLPDMPDEVVGTINGFLVVVFWHLGNPLWTTTGKDARRSIIRMRDKVIAVVTGLIVITILLYALSIVVSPPSPEIVWQTPPFQIHRGWTPTVWTQTEVNK